LAASQSAHLPDTAPQPTARLRNTVAESVTGQIVGRARVLDGDSIAVAGVAIRIFGIDAPEWRQRCRGADGRL
jgi:endonuclease YncB( thermonuclease family)